MSLENRTFENGMFLERKRSIFPELDMACDHIEKFYHIGSSKKSKARKEWEQLERESRRDWKIIAQGQEAIDRAMDRVRDRDRTGRLRELRMRFRK